MLTKEVHYPHGYSTRSIHYTGTHYCRWLITQQMPHHILHRKLQSMAHVHSQHHRRIISQLLPLLLKHYHTNQARHTIVTKLHLHLQYHWHRLYNLHLGGGMWRLLRYCLLSTKDIITKEVLVDMIDYLKIMGLSIGITVREVNVCYSHLSRRLHPRINTIQWQQEWLQKKQLNCKNW